MSMERYIWFSIGINRPAQLVDFAGSLSAALPRGRADFFYVVHTPESYSALEQVKALQESRNVGKGGATIRSAVEKKIAIERASLVGYRFVVTFAVSGNPSSIDQVHEWLAGGQSKWNVIKALKSGDVRAIPDVTKLNYRYLDEVFRLSGEISKVALRYLRADKASGVDALNFYLGTFGHSDFFSESIVESYRDFMIDYLQLDERVINRVLTNNMHLHRTLTGLHEQALNPSLARDAKRVIALWSELRRGELKETIAWQAFHLFMNNLFVRLDEEVVVLLLWHARAQATQR